MTKLLIGVTAHGFGHLAQTAPVIHALRRRLPDVEITVRSGIAPDVLARRIPVAFRAVATEEDFGLVMATPFAVDPTATFERYARLHEGYRKSVSELAAWMRAESFDGVLANISYLLTAAAAQAGIPALAMSSLNWLDLFDYYCGGFDGAAAIAREIETGYADASRIARLEPGMPMPRFETVRIGAAIADVGTPRRAELIRHYGAARSGRVIVFALGGIAPGEPPDWSAELAAQHLLIGPACWASRGPWRTDVAPMPFLDIIASADAVVAKPGYGTVTEAAAAGVPAILFTRGDWPEEPALVGWLHRHGRCSYVDAAMAVCPPEAIFDLCDRLAAAPAPPRPAAGGEEQVADLMVELLGKTGRGPRR